MTTMWEYSRLEIYENEMLMEELNQMGAEGWELVTCKMWGDSSHTTYEVIFKRKM